MTQKSFLWLIIVTILAIGIATFTINYKPNQIKNSIKGQYLLKNLAGDLYKIKNIDLYQSSEEPKISLSKQENQQWLINNKFNYPADTKTVNQFLIDLADAKIVEEKTTNPNYYQRLQVDDPKQVDSKAVLVSLNSNQVSVIIGKSQHEGTTGSYVRKPEEKQSYLVNKQISINLDTKSWMNTLLLDITNNRMQQVTIINDNEQYNLTKTDNEEFSYVLDPMPTNRELKAENTLTSWLNVLSGVRFNDVMPDNLAESLELAAEAKFAANDGLVVTLQKIEHDGKPWLRLIASQQKPNQEIPAQQKNTTILNVGNEDTVLEQSENIQVITQASQNASNNIAIEVEELNAHFSGWLYNISSFKLDAIFKSKEELLIPLETEETPTAESTQ